MSAPATPVLTPVVQPSEQPLPPPARQRRTVLWLWIALAVVGALLVVAVAYLIGQSNANGAKDALAARHAAQTVAFGQARRASASETHAAGLKTGIAEGRRDGERAGTVAGRRAGQAKFNAGQSSSPPANASPPTTPPPATAPTDPSTSPSTRDWPAYTVFIASKATQSEAQTFVDRADAQGFSGSGILYSSDYASLHPGYWVAYIGTYGTKGDAEATISDVHSAGFSDAYVSYVSQGE